MSDQKFTRRAALGAGLAAMGAATLPISIVRGDGGGTDGAGPTSAPSPAPSAKRVLRFAHPTDIHVQPELRGGEGMAAAFSHMMSLADPPALVITGGDLPMDTASTPEARSKVEWDLFTKVLRDTVSSRVPVYHTIGNHDVFGRDKAKSKASGDEPHYLKRWFLDLFGYQRTYRSFDMAGWHFVILDSLLLGEAKDFVGKLDAQQLDWFKQDLAAVPSTTPVVIVSHVPIISVANFFDRDDEEWKPGPETFDIKSSRMHVDCRELDALFVKHRNVKLCLSGHLHLLDRCRYNGVEYICDGAVSGAKWKGPKRQTPEGYGLIDLFDDGTFRHEYVTFGWKA